MLEAITIGWLVGALTGFFFGLGVALLTRDGIWPGVWAFAIIVFGFGGAVITTVEYLIR